MVMLENPWKKYFDSWIQSKNFWEIFPKTKKALAVC